LQVMQHLIADVELVELALMIIPTEGSVSLRKIFIMASGEYMLLFYRKAVE